MAECGQPESTNAENGTNANVGDNGTAVDASGQQVGEDAAKDSAGEKKKRDRWSKAPDAEQADDGGDASKNAEGDGAKKKSRWGTKQVVAPPVATPGLALVPFGAPAAAVRLGLPTPLAPVTPVNPEQVKIQLRIAEIQNLYSRPSLDDYVPNEYWNHEKSVWETHPGVRSPSPEPQYDRLGRRTNTRDLRMRMRLQKERQSLLEKLCQLQPSMAPAFSFQKEKKTCKLFIPQKEYPNYPFIGLILGPRGNTQKKLEKETGAKIIIRGKGSVKDGRRAKIENDPSADEELHVHISADTDESVCLPRRVG